MCVSTPKLCQCVHTCVCRDRDGFPVGLCNARKQQPCAADREAAHGEMTKGRAIRQEVEGEEAEKGLK